MRDNAFKKRIWIAWEFHRRNIELSRALNSELFTLRDCNGSIYQNLKNIWNTYQIIINEKPYIVFGQNPSLVLSFLLAFLRLFFKYRLVIDAHNAGLFPFEGKSQLLNYVAKVIQRQADLTIVTNKALKVIVEKNGGKSVILPDKIPELNFQGKKKLKGNKNLLYINMFSDDEPYLEVIEAAKKINKDIFIYITGDYKKVGLDKDKVPSNVILTGYIPDIDYLQLLYSVDATIVLTKRENCLLCGAHESLSINKPMILSNTNILKSYFNDAAIYVENTPVDIKKGIFTILDQREFYFSQLQNEKMIKIKEWTKKKKAFELIVEEF